MFRRQAFLDLVGISTDRFKALVRRDQLPVLSAAADQEDGSRAWYTNRDVLAVAITERLKCEIGLADGLGAETAAKIVDGALGDLDSKIDVLTARPRSDQWIGYVGLLEDHEPMGGMHIAGSLSSVIARIGDLHEDDTAGRIFLVNVSEVLRSIQARAEGLEISFPSEETGDGE